MGERGCDRGLEPRPPGSWAHGGAVGEGWEHRWKGPPMGDGAMKEARPLLRTAT